MALFRYKAFQENGQKMSGMINAENIQEAQKILVKEKIALISLEPVSEKKTTLPLKKKEMLSFTRELAKLIVAGLPLYEAILSLEEKYRSSRLQSFLLDLADQLKNGKSFSEALQTHEKSFDLLYIAMVANAEKTATLDKALGEIALLIERQEKLKRQFLSTLLYPAFLLGFSFFVIAILLFFILPSLFDLFEGRPLHPFTKVILFCSHFAISHKTSLLLSFSSLLLLSGSGFFFRGVRASLLRIVSYFPFLKGLFIKISFIRYFRSLSVLLGGGVPLLEALQFSREMMSHPLLYLQMREAEKKVKEGCLLSAHLEKSSLVPKWVCRMVALAEKTADLSNMLRHIADIYEEELEKNLAQISTFLQPLFLLILGGIVGLVVLSVLIPLTDVSSFLT